MTDKRIKVAVDDGLVAKGYLYARQNADLTLNYHIMVEDRSTLSADPYGGFSDASWLEPGKAFSNTGKGP